VPVAQVKLTPAQFRVLREKGTERAFTGEYTDKFDDGVYTCVACDAPLYKSATKFHSGCGWCGPLPVCSTPLV
jgi:peptide-methionine (R)-S-oxide reductase